MEKEGQGCPHLGEKEGKVENLRSTISSTTEKYVCQQCIEVALTDKSKGELVEAHIERLESENIWICSECEMVHCGVELKQTIPPYGHALRHFLKRAHPLAVSVEDQHVYCFECKKTVQFGRTQDLLLGDKKKQVKELPPQTSNTDLRCRYLMIGLSNLGNTCFFNSVLQNLLMMNILRDHYVALEQDKDRPITYSLGRHYHVTRPEAEPKTKIPPTVLFNRVCGSWFKAKQQQDSHELLKVFLESLRKEESVSRKKKADEGPTFIELVFQGEISRTISCLVCGETSTPVEPFMDLSLPVPSKKRSSKHQRIRDFFPPRLNMLGAAQGAKVLDSSQTKTKPAQVAKVLNSSQKDTMPAQVAKVYDSSQKDTKHNTKEENKSAEEILESWSIAIDGETDDEDEEVTSKDTSKPSVKDSGCDDHQKVDDEQVVKGSVSGTDFMVDIEKIAKDMGREDAFKAADAAFEEDPGLGIVTSFENFAEIYGPKDFKGEDVSEIANLASKKSPRLDDMGRVKSTHGDVAIKKGSGGVDLGSDKDPKIEPALGSKASVIGQRQLGGFYLSGEEEVDNSGDRVSVESCLKAFTETEDLSKDKDLRCENCDKIARKDADNKARAQPVSEAKSDKKAEDGSSKEIELCHLDVKRHKTMKALIKKTPPILTIHLLRHGATSKIHGHIVFNETLDLAPYMESREGSEAGVVKYRLLGVIEHSGHMGFGHYIAYVRGGHCSDGENDGNDWYCADDDKVTKVTLEAVLRCEAYMLFYRKL